MARILNFYLDDSGTRHPDRDPGRRADHGYDWFALGGILVNEEDEPQARQLHADFCRSWKIEYPLHSVEIRGRRGNFLWLLHNDKQQREKFLEDLYELIRSVPVLGLACVIDRPGYNNRYKEKYGDKRWMLCRTAFSISVERAAKYARETERRLRIHPERCNKEEDRLLQGYYGELKAGGMPFDKDTSEKYGPLSQAQFRETLYDFKIKHKSSPMVQLADLYLWPICMGGYHASNRPYERLKADGKLIECVLPPDAMSMLGSKYSCFENIERRA